MNALQKFSAGNSAKAVKIPPLENIHTVSTPTGTSRQRSGMLFQPVPQSQRHSGAQSYVDRSKQHSDDTEWVMSSRPNLSQRPGFLTGQNAALQHHKLLREQSLQRERHQGMLWDKAGKDKTVTAKHYDDRLCKEGALPPTAALSTRRMQGMLSDRTETAGSETETGRERQREVLQENLDCANVAFYSQGPVQEQQQLLSKHALQERIRLSALHERRTKHEARILAGAEMEEMKKKQREERRLKGIARQKMNHIGYANKREEKRAACDNKKKCNQSARQKNFGPSQENSTLPGLQNKENTNNTTSRAVSTRRDGLSTARLLTGGAVGGKHYAKRNASNGINFNDY